MFQMTPDNATCVTRACIILHNILRDRYPQAQNVMLAAPEGDPGSWRAAGVMESVEAAGGRNPKENREGKQLRAYLKHYYNSVAGSVPWQEAALTRPAR